MRNDNYNPPFVLTEDMINLVVDITDAIKNLDVKSINKQNLKLRRKTRIQSVFSSLAIENNRLSEKQVSDVINGKKVLAPLNEIVEVKNAYEAYDCIDDIDPYSMKDLLKIHNIFMKNLLNSSGKLRFNAVGVYKNKDLIHLGTRPEYIKYYLSELFKWSKNSTLHPLIVASIFHYEFEYIHPFEDGNGRVGRYWHLLLLCKWNPLFKNIPIETMIFERQKEYYNAINKSNNSGNSTPFIIFMLSVIRDSLNKYVIINSKNNVIINEEKILSLIKRNPRITTSEIAKLINMSQRQVARIISNLKSQGIVERSGANKNGFWTVK